MKPEPAPFRPGNLLRELCVADATKMRRVIESILCAADASERRAQEAGTPNDRSWWLGRCAGLLDATMLLDGTDSDAIQNRARARLARLTAGEVLSRMRGALATGA